MTSRHVVSLPGGSFEIWRWACLRGAGLPASMVLDVAARDAARAAAAVVEADEAVARAQRTASGMLLAAKHSGGDASAESARKALRLVQKMRPPLDTGTAADEALRAFRAALERASAAKTAYADALEAARLRSFETLQRLARHGGLREAVTWQNRGAIASAFEPLARADAAHARTKDRQHAALVARYLQRYCAKNDTIGFFGPVGWARWTDDDAAVVLTPARELAASRGVYFEQWPIDEIAKKATADERLAPWRTARRLAFVRVDGRVAASATGARHELTDAEASLLAACDGTRTTRELARDGRWGGEEEVASRLASLRDKDLVVWAFEIPLSWNPEAALASVYARIEDLALRSEALAPIAALDAARTKVAAAAGDAAALSVALDALDTEFTSATGASATRNAGSFYAGRQIVFEDCRRGGDLVLGTRLREQLGPPLSLVLTSARWFTHEIGRVYRNAVRAKYEELARRAGTPVIGFQDLWLRVQGLFVGARTRPIDAVVEELDRRWGSILGFAHDARRIALQSDALRSRVDEVFAAPDAGWTAARQHSPDVLIAAESVDAIARDDYMLVLGELHAAVNTLDTQLFVKQHPDEREVDDAFIESLPGPRVVSVDAKDWPGVTVRTADPVVTPKTTFLETGRDRANAPRERVVAAADLVVSDYDGRLVVSVREGTTQPTSFAPMELGELLGQMLSAIAASRFRIRAGGARRPRVTVDRLVICRETWTFPPAEIPFVDVADDARAFLESRRWAASHQLPRFVFVKSPTEPKPMYFDLESLTFVSLLAKIARAARDDPAVKGALSFTEMLPGLDQAWLADESGARFTCEIRLVAFDRASGVCSPST